MQTYPLYLNGEFVQSEPVWNVINPANSEAFAKSRPSIAPGWLRQSWMRTPPLPVGGR